MFLELKKILIAKKGNSAKVSAEYNLFKINNISLDLTNGSNPVRLLSFEGNEIVTGELIKDLKEKILDVFQEVLVDAEDSIYSVTYSKEEIVEKI